jgi:hypothetical protein
VHATMIGLRDLHLEPEPQAGARRTVRVERAYFLLDRR